MVEQRTENPRVTGSIPVLGILFIKQMTDGILAQVVEHLTFNQVVPGSSPGCLMEEKKIMLGDLLFLYLKKRRDERVKIAVVDDDDRERTKSVRFCGNGARSAGVNWSAANLQTAKIS